ncbi:hypothetical protein H4R34_006004, partial [Dimargaris verticillata]
MESESESGPTYYESSSSEYFYRSSRVHKELNAEVQANTVVVDVELLLAQAKPRRAEALNQAIAIHNQLCDSDQLNSATSNLKLLAAGQCDSKRAVYPGLKQLLDICARAVYDSVSVLERDDPVRQETRLLQSTDDFSYLPRDSNNSNRTSIAITARAVRANGFPSPAYRALWENIAAVVKVTCSEVGQRKRDKTCGQLARSIVDMYKCQPNRRFA